MGFNPPDVCNLNHAMAVMPSSHHHVLSCLCRRCEHGIIGMAWFQTAYMSAGLKPIFGACEQHWQQAKIVSDRKFRNCFVQSRNAVVPHFEDHWKQSWLVANFVHTPIKQDSLVLSVSVVWATHKSDTFHHCQWLVISVYLWIDWHYLCRWSWSAECLAWSQVLTPVWELTRPINTLYLMNPVHTWRPALRDRDQLLMDRNCSHLMKSLHLKTPWFVWHLLFRGVARGGAGGQVPPPAQRGQIFFGARWVRLRPTWYRLPPQAKNPSYAPAVVCRDIA